MVLSQVLPSAWSLGYEDCRDLLVDTIDGRPIGGLSDVVAAFAEAQGPSVRLTFEPSHERSEIVIGATELEAVTAEILEAYGIPSAVRLPVRPPPPFEG